MSVSACIVSHAPWYQLSDIVGTMCLREAYASLSRSEADYDYCDRSPCRYEIHQRFNRGDHPHLEVKQIPPVSSRRAVNLKDEEFFNRTHVGARGIFAHQILSLILASETGQNLNSNMSGSARIRISWTTIRKNISAGCSLAGLPSFMHRSFINFHNFSIER